MILLNRQEMIKSLDEFIDIYRQRPIIDNSGGMGSVHMFYTWYVCKSLQPSSIIESGIWKGQSSWLFRRTCPDAKIISIDPHLEYREYICPTIYYTPVDFAYLDWNSFVDVKETLCFFDDHYGVDRLKQAHDFGFKHILYEDNYHDGRGNVFHPIYGDIANQEPLHLGTRSYSPKAVRRLKTKDFNWTLENIQTYWEFPPIYSIVDSPRGYKWAKVSREQYLEMTESPLLTEYKSKYQIYYDDYDYTWIAYIKLKDK